MSEKIGNLIYKFISNRKIPVIIRATIFIVVVVIIALLCLPVVGFILYILEYLFRTGWILVLVLGGLITLFYFLIKDGDNTIADNENEEIENEK